MTIWSTKSGKKRRQKGKSVSVRKKSHGCPGWRSEAGSAAWLPFLISSSAITVSALQDSNHPLWSDRHTKLGTCKHQILPSAFRDRKGAWLLRGQSHPKDRKTAILANHIFLSFMFARCQNAIRCPEREVWKGGENSLDLF